MGLNGSTRPASARLAPRWSTTAAIVEAAIEPDDGALRVGTIARARLVELLPGRAGRLSIDGGDAHLAAVPPGITQGAALTVEITREAIPEPGRAKPARAVATDAEPAPGPDLHARIAATGLPVRTMRPHEPDALEEAGWSELLDEAKTGEIVFVRGALRMTPTPAMTLFDVDGAAPLDDLALAAAAAVAAGDPPPRHRRLDRHRLPHPRRQRPSPGASLRRSTRTCRPRSSARR